MKLKKLNVYIIGLMLLSAGKSRAAADSLDIKIGQMIMVGINDRKEVADTDFLLSELNSYKVGGVVLFEKNISSTNSYSKLKSMISTLKAQSTIPLLVSIDEEGGKVHRLKEKYGFVGMPSAAYLGALNNKDTTLFYVRRLAAELSGLGINFNYAPSVDLAVNPANTVIVQRERSYSASPNVVSNQAQLCVMAHHENGVQTILKHFPGHGSSTADSHLGIVDVSNTWDFSELYPYHTLIRTGNCDAIMTAHIVNKKWDSSLLPATLSAKVIGGLLRGVLGYDGVIFSDDMQMHAISKEYGLDKAITLSINAGVDILMFANNVKVDEPAINATEVHARIKKLVQQGKIPMSRINQSYLRIMKMKGKILRS